MKSSPSIWQYVVSVKSTVKISSIFVAFLENMNFIIRSVINRWSDCIGQDRDSRHLGTAIPGFPQSDHTVGKPSADTGSLCSES